MSDQPRAVTKSFKINFEAMANDLAAKVNEMEAVLAWASENMWSIGQRTVAVGLQ